MKMYLAKLALLCIAAGLVACQSPPRAASSGTSTAPPQSQSSIASSTTVLPIVVVKRRPTVADTRLLLEVQPPQPQLRVTSSAGQSAECTGIVDRCLVDLVSHLKLGQWVVEETVFQLQLSSWLGHQWRVLGQVNIEANEFLSPAFHVNIDKAALFSGPSLSALTRQAALGGSFLPRAVRIPDQSGFVPVCPKGGSRMWLRSNVGHRGWMAFDRERQRC